MEYASELIFFGLIELMHIFLASIPICSEEKFESVLPHAWPIPDTGVVLCSDSALMIPEMYVDSLLKLSPLELFNSKS